jgi:tellurite methyltransferase
VLPELRPGRALDLACGSGRDAVFMAACGWSVTGVDVLPDALDRARDLARRCATAIEPIDWRQVDLEQGGEPPMPESCFDLIVGFRYLYRPLFAHFAAWLKPGGSVVYETFTTLHRERHGRPASDDHVLQPGELPGLLSGFEIRHFSEAWRGTAHTARIWAARD